MLIFSFQSRLIPILILAICHRSIGKVLCMSPTKLYVELETELHNSKTRNCHYFMLIDFKIRK